MKKLFTLLTLFFSSVTLMAQDIEYWGCEIEPANIIYYPQPRTYSSLGVNSYISYLKEEKYQPKANTVGTQELAHMSEFYLDSIGYLIAVKHQDYYKTKYFTAFMYNNDRTLDKVIIRENGNLKWLYSYTYDEKSFLKAVGLFEYEGDNAKLSMSWKRERLPDSKIKVTCFNKPYSKTECIIADDKIVSKHYEGYHNGSILNVRDSEYSYNPNGDLNSIIEVAQTASKKDQFKSARIFEYNSNGLIQSVEDTSRDKETYEYSFDESNNWIKCVNKCSNGIYSIERTYNYSVQNTTLK